MYLVDFARGLAYKERKGFIIMVDPCGLYIIDKLRMVFLTNKNTKIFGSEL